MNELFSSTQRDKEHVLCDITFSDAKSGQSLTQHKSQRDEPSSPVLHLLSLPTRFLYISTVSVCTEYK